MVEISFKYKVMIYVTILITERANGKIVNLGKGHGFQT